MEFSFESKVQVTFENNGGPKSKHVETDFQLYISDNLDPDAYFDADGLPNANGCEVMRVNLVQGLIGVIELSNSKGYANDFYLLKKSIEEAEKGFAMVKELSKSTFNKKS